MVNKLFEKIYNMTHPEPLREMAMMVLIESNPSTLPKGMRIDVITTEHTGTGEEPHFHLFPASHIAKKGKANNDDLITRVALTEIPPGQPSDVHSIAGNNPVPKEYQKAIFDWSQKDDEESGLNNWKQTRLFWNKQTASFCPQPDA